MIPDPNLAMLERIAEALGPLRRRVVFLGGCATGLLITDPAAARICRWILGEALVDVMPVDPSVLGFANRWYPEALRHLL